MSVSDIFREIDEAQERSMRALLDGWQHEIEAQEQALLEQRKKHLEQDAQDAALAASVAAYLQGLYEQAASGNEVSSALPLDVRVASTSICGPSSAALSALMEDTENATAAAVDGAQRSAAWAVSHGLVPHPGDLGQILSSHGVDDGFAQRFQELGSKLDQLDTSFKNPQLQAHLGAARLDIVRDTVRLLDAYTPERTLRMVSNPASLLELPGKIGAPSASGGANPRMGRAQFNRMLDSLFV